MTDITVIELDVCTSTQDEVRDRLTSVAAGDVVVVSATSQREGRGREGRAWQDPPGEALLLSVGRRGPLPVSVLQHLPARVAQVLLDVLDAGDAIRWQAPNDLVAADGAKVGGILIDARTVGEVVDVVIVGVGVNLAGSPFRLDDTRLVTTVESVTGVPRDRTAMLGTITSRIARLVR